MKLCIVGWYGTETIGDRAIFAGILSILKQHTDTLTISLGAIHPFFTQRMLREDMPLFEEQFGKNLNILLFDSTRRDQLERNIQNADMCLVGGGPLMHIPPMKMLNHFMSYANKKNKPTVLFGCGVGPLFDKKYQKITVQLLDKADAVVLRDEASRKSAEQLTQQFMPGKLKSISAKTKVSYDPAVECALKFMEFNERKPSKQVVVNLRSFPNEYAQGAIKDKVEGAIAEFMKKLDAHHEEILLVPMHYFSIGGDDRYFLNSLVQENELQNTTVQNTPLTLAETMHSFQNAATCVGMRFHSVILQTILNGNNYILDYTEPGKGKISGFVDSFDGHGFYDKRMLNLQELDASGLDKISVDGDASSSRDFTSVKETLKVYHQTLEELLNR